MVFSVRRNLAWMALSQAGLFILQFGGSLVVARLLTPYDMGVFAVAMAVVGLISILRAVGLGSYLVRDSGEDAATAVAVFTINAAIALIVSTLICLISALGGFLLNETGVRNVLLVLALVPLIGVFELLPSTGLERSGDFRSIALVSLLRTLVGTLVMLAFAFSGFSYMSLAYGHVAGAVVSALVSSLIGRRHVRFRFGLQGWREIGTYGLQMLAISGVNVLSSRFAEILLGRMLGLDALGLYSRASGLSALLWDNVHLVITRVVFVDFSQQKRRGESLREAYLRIVQLITALLWPAFTGLAVIAGPLILTLYGEVWVGAALPLSLLSLAAVVLVSITMTWEVFVVCGQTGRQARFEFIRAGVGMALFAGGCLVGLGWSAAARVGEALFSVALYRPHLARMTDTTSRDFKGIYASSFLLTVVAVGPSAAVMSYHGWNPEAPLLPVLGSVAGGILCWAALLAGTGHPLALEGKALFVRLLPSQLRRKVR